MNVFIIPSIFISSQVRISNYYFQ